MVNKKSMLKTAIFSVTGLLISTCASAAITGTYLGGELGWGETHQINKSTIQSSGLHNTKDAGIAGRILAGFQSSPNLATEIGFTKFYNAHATDSSGNRYKFNTYAVDLVVKAIMPLQNGVNIYGKLGAAYLEDKTTITIPATAKLSDTQHKILPTFGAGISYDISSNVSSNVSWSHIQRIGNSNGLNNTDLVALGFAYHLD